MAIIQLWPSEGPDSILSVFNTLSNDPFNLTIYGQPQNVLGSFLRLMDVKYCDNDVAQTAV